MKTRFAVHGPEVWLGGGLVDSHDQPVIDEYVTWGFPLCQKCKVMLVWAWQSPALSRVVTNCHAAATRMNTCDAHACVPQHCVGQHNTTVPAS